MSQHLISGDLTLQQIADSIISIEVTRNKFVGAFVRGPENVASFVRQRVPPMPHLIVAGKPAPENTTLSWSGILRVEGKDANIEIYRSDPAAAKSAGDLGAQIEMVQSALSLKMDGSPGPRTWTAIAEALDVPIPTEVRTTNPRSEAVIATLLPEVRTYARALFFKAKERGIDMTLISGTRTFEEQDALYKIGRNAKGKIVGKIRTKAKGGYSNHNFGIGFDVAVMRKGKYMKEAVDYEAVGVLGEEVGLDWGGRWKSFPDASHFQLRPAWASGMTEAAMLARLRAENPGGIAPPKQLTAKLARHKKLGGPCRC